MGSSVIPSGGNIPRYIETQNKTLTAAGTIYTVTQPCIVKLSVTKGTANGIQYLKVNNVNVGAYNNVSSNWFTQCMNSIYNIGEIRTYNKNDYQAIILLLNEGDVLTTSGDGAFKLDIYK